MNIEIDIQDYIEMLNDRRYFIEKNHNWTIPDIVWDYFINSLEEGIIPYNTSPSYVVDNIAVNGDYGNFEDMKYPGETDEEFIERIKDDCLYIDIENKFAIISL